MALWREQHCDRGAARARWRVAVCALPVAGAAAVAACAAGRTCPRAESWRRAERVRRSCCEGGGRRPWIKKHARRTFPLMHHSSAFCIRGLGTRGLAPLPLWRLSFSTTITSNITVTTHDSNKNAGGWAHPPPPSLSQEGRGAPRGRQVAVATRARGRPGRLAQRPRPQARGRTRPTPPAHTPSVRAARPAASHDEHRCDLLHAPARASPHLTTALGWHARWAERGATPASERGVLRRQCYAPRADLFCSGAKEP